MDKSIRNRFSIIAFVIVASMAGLIWGQGLTGFPRNVAQLKENFRNNIHLGLDLRGGTHLVLQVHVDDAVRVNRDQTMDRLREELKSRKIAYVDLLPCADKATCSDLQKRDADITHIFVQGVPDDRSADLQSLATEQLSDWEMTRVAGDPQSRTISLKASVLSTTRTRALEQAMETIRRRIDAYGVKEAPVSEYGSPEDYELVVEIPGVDDPSRIMDLIQSTALLELKLVQDGPFPSREAALSAHGGILPPDAQLVAGVPGSSSEPGSQLWYLLNRVAAITGRDLTGAESSVDQNGRPDVTFTLTRDGAARFGRVTGENIGRSLAIVLDNRVESAPRIDGRITDRGEITGSFTQAQTADLSLKLRSGALPASISYLSQETVGPSLGADSIRHGIIASIVGSIAIMVFMLIYYRGAGINADLALTLNLVILIALLAYLGATLTLPGIAGVILTVGMGVDSNVLIFERIREELRLGKAVGSAVASGFQHAFRTIIDTHVTTITSAAILFAFGTGPIRGFAVTLIYGLAANLFTSVFVSRAIFDYVLEKRAAGTPLSI